MNFRNVGPAGPAALPACGLAVVLLVQLAHRVVDVCEDEDVVWTTSHTLGQDVARLARVALANGQRRILEQQLEECRWVYNETLAERKRAYQQRGETLCLYATQALLPVWKLTGSTTE